MPPKKVTKKQSATKSTESKTPKSNSKKNTRRKKNDSDSEESFRMSDVSEHNSDMEEEVDIKKKLNRKFNDGDESDFEPLEPWDDVEKVEKGKNKRVKKSSAEKSTTSKSTTSAAPKGGNKRDSKKTLGLKEEGGVKKKGMGKAKAVAGNLRVRLDAPKEDNDGEGGDMFATDEHPQFNESSAYIPNFIQEPHIRDKEGRYSNDVNYDPTTLFVPPEELKKTGPLLRQYWEMKQNHYEKLVAIKVWKFYYFYFHDAIIVHRIIDMKMTMTSNYTYTFFHESCMARFAPKLLAAGYKIVIIEQMEEIKQNKDDVIKREICQILTRGTAIENQDLDYASRYLLAIYEEDLNFGVAFVDTTTHEFYIGEFKDDFHRSNLRTLITRTKPVEVVYMRNYLDNDTLKMLKSLSVKPSYSTLSFNEPRHFEDIFEGFEKYFAKEDEEEEEIVLPELIENMRETVELELKGAKKLEGTRLFEFEKKVPFFATFQALAIANTFLENVLLAETVIPMSNFQPFDVNLEKKGTLYLDSQALQNLEVLDVQYLNMFSESHSLFGYMDKTVSAFGKRMLKRWLTSPFLDAEKIKERQDAVEDLMRNEQFMQVFQDRLAKFADLERLINRIYNLGNRQRMSAIYYEDFAKNRLKEFLTFLTDLRKVEELINEIAPYTLGLKSKRVLQLACFKDVDIKAFEKRKKVVKKKSAKKGKKSAAIEEEEEDEDEQIGPSVEGIFPRINNIIKDLEGMVELVDGLPIPAPGVNKESDAIIAQINEIKTALNKYLELQKKNLKSDEIKYTHSKHRYELEVPERLVEGSKRPADFAITSKRKGYLRFHTPEIEGHLRKLWRIEAEFQKVLVPFICDYFRKFYERNAYWQQIIDCLGELDCLCSLAKLANTLPTRCKPEVLPMSPEPIFELKGMVHPMAAKANPNFVPNDIVVEDDVDIFLITGPNMGGKSTLLRQTCLAVIMAQVGSFVPAESFKLTAVDRIFTRVGASDRIFEGKSTFFIEMEETYSIMTEATKNSMLIIDELGRGTSTYDGVAIAYATLKYIAERIGAITLFATHYHLLLEEFRLYKNIDTYFMQCEVQEGSDDIKFLYKFGKGQAVKSHGIIIAKVAGLPDHVIAQAKHKAAFMTNEKRNIGFEKNLMEKFNKIIDELTIFADEPDVIGKKSGRGGKKSKKKEIDVDKVLLELSQLH